MTDELSFTFTQTRMDELTLDELALMTDSGMGERVPLSLTLDMMARFLDLRNGSDQEAEYSQKRRYLGRLKRIQQSELFRAFNQALENFTLPPENGAP